MPSKFKSVISVLSLVLFLQVSGVTEAAPPLASAEFLREIETVHQSVGASQSSSHLPAYLKDINDLESKYQETLHAIGDIAEIDDYGVLLPGSFVPAEASEKFMSLSQELSALRLKISHVYALTEGYETFKHSFSEDSKMLSQSLESLSILNKLAEKRLSSLIVDGDGYDYSDERLKYLRTYIDQESDTLCLLSIVREKIGARSILSINALEQETPLDISGLMRLGTERERPAHLYNMDTIPPHLHNMSIEIPKGEEFARSPSRILEALRDVLGVLSNAAAQEKLESVNRWIEGVNGFLNTHQIKLDVLQYEMEEMLENTLVGIQKLTSLDGGERSAQESREQSVEDDRVPSHDKILAVMPTLKNGFIKVMITDRQKAYEHFQEVSFSKIKSLQSKISYETSIVSIFNKITVYLKDLEDFLLHYGSVKHL